MKQGAAGLWFSAHIYLQPKCIYCKTLASQSESVSWNILYTVAVAVIIYDVDVVTILVFCLRHFKKECKKFAQKDLKQHIEDTWSCLLSERDSLSSSIISLLFWISSLFCSITVFSRVSWLNVSALIWASRRSGLGRTRPLTYTNKERMIDHCFPFTLNERMVFKNRSHRE